MHSKETILKRERQKRKDNPGNGRKSLQRGLYKIRGLYLLAKRPSQCPRNQHSGTRTGEGEGSLLLYLYTKPRRCLGQASCPNHPCSSVPILKCCVTHSKLRRDVAFLKGHSTLISWLVRGSARAWTQASELGVTSSAYTALLWDITALLCDIVLGQVETCLLVQECCPMSLLRLNHTVCGCVFWGEAP